MGIFRYTNIYAAPTKEQRERYMTGKSEERLFGPDNQIMLIEYREAAYLKDDIDDVRILFTGFRDKMKASDEAKRLADYHQQKEKGTDLFVTARELTGTRPSPSDRRSG